MNYDEIEKQQIHRLQIYCEQHVKLGDIVADRFNAEWMDDCWEYIKEQVQKDRESGKGAQIWHTAIYRLCRDYFNDNLHEVREKEKAEKEAKKKELIANVKAQNKAAKAKAEKEAKKHEAQIKKTEKKANPAESDEPKENTVLIGVDVAKTGGDKTAVINGNVKELVKASEAQIKAFDNELEQMSLLDLMEA